MRTSDCDPKVLYVWRTWVLFHSFCYRKVQGPKYIDNVFTASYFTEMTELYTLISSWDKLSDMWLRLVQRCQLGDFVAGSGEFLEPLGDFKPNRPSAFFRRLRKWWRWRQNILATTLCESLSKHHIHNRALLQSQSGHSGGQSGSGVPAAVAADQHLSESEQWTKISLLVKL